MIVNMFEMAVFADEQHSVSDNGILTLPEEGLQEAGPGGIARGFSRLGVTGKPLWDLI